MDSYYRLRYINTATSVDVILLNATFKSKSYKLFLPPKTIGKTAPKEETCNQHLKID